jgi:histidine triad (HIT) family protein
VSVPPGPSCIFCRIVAGTADASFVYEDDDLVAFMDINPVTRGHLLVVPRAHLPGLADVPPQVGGRMFVVGRELAAALRAGPMTTQGINLFLADGAAAMQSVFHAHLHVIPRFRGDGFRFVRDHWSGSPDRTELEADAAAVRAALGGAEA